MKKLLSVLMLIALTSTMAASAAESRLQNYVDKKLAPITTKEIECKSRSTTKSKCSKASRIQKTARSS